MPFKKNGSSVHKCRPQEYMSSHPQSILERWSGTSAAIV